MVQNGDQDDEDHCYGKEEEEENEWTLCDVEEATQGSHVAKSPYAEHGTQSNSKRLTGSQHYRTPEEAAWELRNEVVTLELKNSSGTLYSPSLSFAVLGWWCA